MSSVFSVSQSGGAEKSDTDDTEDTEKARESLFFLSKYGRWRNQERLVNKPLYKLRGSRELDTR